jgi:alkylation response protein AidB-like acyl-CoA dehydrogenase
MTGRGPDIVHAWVPTDEVEIHDTWQVSGLRGTGSFDFSIADLFVPNRRVFRLLDPSGHRREPLYQMPPLGLYTYLVPCVSLGIARPALDELLGVASTKVPTLYTAPLAERAETQTTIARAEARLGGARAFLHEAVDAIWRTVSSGGEPSPRALALGRAAATQAAEAGAEVARTANALAGGSAIYADSPFQRHARDAEAVLHHFTVARHTWEQAGRVPLGQEPGVPAF